MISEYTANVSLLTQLALVSFFLGWNGLSIHAQVASVLSKSDIRYRPYFIGRILHAVLGFLLTFIFWDLLRPLSPQALPTWTTGNHFAPMPGWMYLQISAFVILSMWLVYLLKQTWKRQNKAAG
jgi:hypothetical protein